MLEQRTCALVPPSPFARPSSSVRALSSFLSVTIHPSPPSWSSAATPSPQLTGVPFPPNYDPANMPLEVPRGLARRSRRRPAGREGRRSLQTLDLDHTVGRRSESAFLSSSVSRTPRPTAHAPITQQGAWPLVVQQFDLPEAMPSLHKPAELQPTAAVLERYLEGIMVGCPSMVSGS
ncbi:hypothetical protein OH77DRAFT_814386 [Trametes cingulata]|nr:hypothetical protein OH77DRAFT_814386 [Trametes cingulata]